MAISVVKRQAKNPEAYDLVIERIHDTGLDPLFQGPIPPPISAMIVKKEHQLQQSYFPQLPAQSFSPIISPNQITSSVDLLYATHNHNENGNEVEQ